MIYTLLSFLDRVFPFLEVFAHCDIPCGIYTAEPAQTAAKTVAKMVEKIQQLSLPNLNNAQDVQVYENSISRFVAAKEEYAKICKTELLILWTDYFKPEHIVMFPDLHEKFWKAGKLCSKAKQTVDSKIAQDLLDAVEEIEAMFQKAEEAKKK